MNNSEFLTVEQAAKLVGTSKKTIYNEINNPKFPAKRLTPKGRIFINREKLIQYFS